MIEKWIVSYTDPAPVTVTLDLKQPHVLARATLFYSGTLPDLRAEGSADGQTWSPLASHTAQPATPDVLDVTLPLAGKHRYVRFAFGARTGNAAMELCEVEVWGRARE